MSAPGKLILVSQMGGVAAQRGVADPGFSRVFSGTLWAFSIALFCCFYPPPKAMSFPRPPGPWVILLMSAHLILTVDIPVTHTSPSPAAVNHHTSPFPWIFFQSPLPALPTASLLLVLGWGWGGRDRVPQSHHLFLASHH